MRVYKPLKGKLRVVIVYESFLMRASIRYYLEQEKDIQVIGECGDGIRAVKLIKELKPDVVIIDVKIPKLNGIEVAKKVAKIDEDISILFLTTEDDDSSLKGFLQIGAAGYITDKVNAKELTSAVRSVYQGEAIVDSMILRKLLRRASLLLDTNTKTMEKDAFPPRELEVLKLVAKGLRDKDIAKSMFITVSTVKAHVSHLLHRLDANTRTEAVVKAVEKGLFTLDKLD